MSQSAHKSRWAKSRHVMQTQTTCPHHTCYRTAQYTAEKSKCNKQTVLNHKHTTSSMTMSSISGQTRANQQIRPPTSSNVRDIICQSRHLKMESRKEKWTNNIHDHAKHYYSPAVISSALPGLPSCTCKAVYAFWCQTNSVLQRALKYNKAMYVKLYRMAECEAA